MKNKTTAAQAAKQIRQVLKKNFPDVLFRVKSKSYSMGNRVRIGWDNGPTNKQVEEIVMDYQYGSFDGMTDCYNYTNSRDDIPQVKHVICDRNITEDIYQRSFEFGKKYLSSFEKINNIDEYGTEGRPRDLLWKYITKIDFRQDFTFEVFRQAVLN